MTAPRQLDFPANGRIGDFGWDILAVPYARAVRASESGPLLGGEAEGQGSQRGDGECRRKHSSPALKHDGLR